MRRLFRLGLRLYPRSWRERYGVEFQALLEDVHPRWWDLFDVLKEGVFMRFRYSHLARTAAVFGLLGSAVALIAYFATPKLWTSEVRFSISAFNKPVGRDHVAELSRAALDKSHLQDAIREFDLYPTERSRLQSSAVVQRMEKNFKIRSDSASNFRIAFTYDDPAVAQRVANWGARRLVEANFQLAISGTVNRSDVPLATMRIEQPASLPERPTSPNRFAIAAFGLAGGLVLDGGIAILRRRLNRT